MLIIASDLIVDLTTYRALQYPIVMLLFFDDVDCDFWPNDCGKTFNAVDSLLNSFKWKVELLSPNACHFVENKRRKNQFHFTAPDQLQHPIARSAGNNPGRNQDIGIERDPHPVCPVRRVPGSNGAYLRTSSTTRSMSSSVSIRSAAARCRTARRNPLSFWRSRYKRRASRISSLFVRRSFLASFSVSRSSRGGIERVTILLCLIALTSCVLRRDSTEHPHNCQFLSGQEWI